MKNFKYYFTGLIEGDGCIYVPSEGKKSHIKILIAFHENDAPLAEFIKEKLNMGTISNVNGEHCVVWTVNKEEEIFNLLTFMNGCFRTPKIVALKKGLNYFNEKYKLNIPFLPLDNSDILSNPWATGFSDADGSFSLELSKNSNDVIVSMTPTFKIEVARDYINPVREELGGQSNMCFMQSIASAFNVKVNSYSRTGKNGRNDTFSLKLSINRVDNFSLLVSYFKKFPLLSSKYFNYMDCAKVHSEKINIRSMGLSLASSYDDWVLIKNGMNTKRDFSKINWDHLYNLNHFYSFPTSYSSDPNSSLIIRTHTNSFEGRFTKKD